MFCARCGNNLTGATWDFCPKCGARKATQQNSVNPQHSVYPRPQSDNGMSGRKIVGVVLVIIGLILFIVGIVQFNSGEQQLARAFGYSGPETIMPILLMVGGGVALVIGVVLALLKGSNAGATRAVSGFNHGNSQHGGNPMPQPGEGKAIASLVLGIVGIVAGMGIISGPVGIFLAISAKNDGLTDGTQKAGFICSIIGTAVGVITIISFIYAIRLISSL